MSTQTGIVPDDKLFSFFGKCRDGRYRMLKVTIKNEALTLDSFVETSGPWDREWDRIVLGAIDSGEPCYLLYRLDEKDGATFRWLLISWSPDDASIRNKMLYASTKATLKKEFGAGQIKDDLYGNVKEDITLEGYRKHVLSAAAPGPLSREEIEREEVKAQQSQTAVSVDSKHQTMTGIQFPMSNELTASLADLGSKRTEYVQMSIDVKRETVNLEENGTCSVAELPKKVPDNVPRYHLFRFKHVHEGDAFNSVVFIYTMPGYNCSIKERMLYASCCNSVAERVEAAGIEVAKKIEVDSGDELTQEFLYSELHPVKNLNRPKFAKPAPPSRGNRRITKQPMA